MEKIIRIGTRDSRLAVWQASQVKAMLEIQGCVCELVKVKSEGDLDLVTPLYAMGVQGVFTKTLDAYLLSNKIDVAVHSMKDVPTQLAQGIATAAVLKRANYKDLFVYKNEHVLEKYFYSDVDEQRLAEGVIATGSVRRKAALLNKFPKIRVENLRGNVQTRMQKLMNNDWDAAIFAAAGLERLDERPAYAIEIDWMLPAPAQGAIAVVCREEDVEVKEICAPLNDQHTMLCVNNERDFLKTLMGGCSTPVSALAQVEKNKLKFSGNIIALDGSEILEIEKEVDLRDATEVGIGCAQELLANGADKIVEQIRSINK